MIKYTTKDIIKRAEQLTDFTSSDFISLQEKIYLLNDAYTLIYQLLVNAQDKTFLKSCEIGNVTKLPFDLFQIHSVKDASNQLLKKRGESQDWGYDIIDGKIIGSSQSYKLKYYPNPKTLFLRDTSLLDLSLSFAPLVYNDNFYTTLSEGMLSIIDSINNTTIKSYTDTTDTICHLKNGIVDFANKTFTPYGALSSYSFDCLMVKGNEAMLDKVISDTLSDNAVLYVTDNSETQQFFIDSNLNVYLDTQCTKKVETLDSNMSFYCRQDGLFYSSKGEYLLKRLDGAIVEYLPIALYPFECFIDDSYIIVSGDNSFKKTGYGFDSLLEYPNNVFYSYLAYDLAISMCNVVQRDATALLDKADEIKNQLLNSIVQDKNEVYAIKDVNSSRGGIWL